MAGYIENGNAQAAIGGMNTAQGFMEMQMRQKQQELQNKRQGMFDQIAMRQADREQQEYAQQQAHKKQMADVMRGYLRSRFNFGGPNDAMGGPGGVPGQQGQQQMNPQQMAMMEANAAEMPPPDPRNAKAADVLPAMGVDANLEPWQQNIKSVIENGDYDTLKELIPYVQDQDGFIKSQAIAQAVSSGKLDGNLLADPKDRAYFQFLAQHRPTAVMGAIEDLFRSQRQKQDQIDEETRRNKYAMESEDRATKRQIDTEQRGLVNDQTRGQNALKQSLAAQKQQDEYLADQLGPAARMVNTEDMGNLYGPPSVDENALSTMRSLPPEMQARAIADKFGARQEAGNRRGVAENLIGAGVDPQTAAALAAASRGGQVPPSLMSSAFNNKAALAAAQRRVVDAAKVYRQTGEQVDKRMGKVMTIPGSENAPTKDEVEKARTGDKRATARIRAWNDLVQARQALEQTSGGIFSGVKQSADAFEHPLDPAIDEEILRTGGDDEINGMIQLGE